MADGILYGFVGEIMNKLSSEVIKELGMMCGINDDITKLTNTASTIKSVLVDAEKQQYENNAIKDWLGKLKHALYDVEDVVDEFSCEALRRKVMTNGKMAKQVCIFFSQNNQLLFANKIAHEIKNVRETLDAIAADRNKFGLTEIVVEPNDPHVSERDTHSHIREEEVIGRNDDKENIKNDLLKMDVKHNISFIVIAGMGGLGKTTLAKYLYNDEYVYKFFDLKMWVSVSESFDVEVIVKKIIERLTDKSPDGCDMESLKIQLDKVIGGKKYLLVLDDIWNENEEKWSGLKNLLLLGGRGSKILITQRGNKPAAEIDDMTLVYNLKELSEENSWSLFKKVAFKEGEEPNNPNLIKLGKEIVQKCKGVPIVIRSIGRSLHSETSEEKWMSIKNKLQPANDVMSNLKLSYDHLPTSYLKQCFVYCSLFPKDCSMSKDKLTRQFIAQGFVPSSSSSKSEEDTEEHDFFMELCWRSMLLSSDSETKEKNGIFRQVDGFPSIFSLYISSLLIDRKKYKMHDLMHELAQKVASDECRYINYEDHEVVDEKTRHISIQYDDSLDDESNLPTSIFNAKGLRTLLLHDTNRYIDTSTLKKLFSSCVHLRVLELSGLIIEKVPKSIEKLRQLRYLDLSRNWNLKHLPNSITKLQNLQTLDLHECINLKKLPRDIKNLVNLRHLHVHGTGLKHMPKGMGKLTSLQTLNFFVLGNKKKHACKLSELQGLNCLKGVLAIKGLEELHTTPSEASLVRLKDKEYLRQLYLIWYDYSLLDDEVNDEMVLEGLEPHPNVESLGITGYLGGKLSNWVSSLSELIVIQIVGCKRLQHLPQFDLLPHLKCLTLMRLDALEFIDIKDSFSSSAVFFPSLQYLHLYLIDNLKGWWKSEPCSLPCFPPLTAIEISRCPKLVSMPLHSDLVSVGLCEISLKKLKFPIASSLCPTDPSSTNSFSPSALDHLRLDDIDDLEFLPNRLWQHLNNLESLQISYCQNLKSEDLQNESCSEGKLKDLRLYSLPKLVSLPIGPQRLATLQSLYIDNCCNLTHLPEWIGSLVSLSRLSITKCPNLKSLPEGMRQLQSLQILAIHDCPELQERCKTGGEDWPKIAHIPRVLSSLTYGNVHTSPTLRGNHLVEMETCLEYLHVAQGL